MKPNTDTALNSESPRKKPRLALALATSFGVGYVPKAPGTFGSLVGIVSQRLVPRIKGGFVPACEVMFCNPAISNMIRENKTHEIPSVIETSLREGMIYKPPIGHS